MENFAGLGLADLALLANLVHGALAVRELKDVTFVRIELDRRNFVSARDDRVGGDEVLANRAGAVGAANAFDDELLDIEIERDFLSPRQVILFEMEVAVLPVEDAPHDLFDLVLDSPPQVLGL